MIFPALLALIVSFWLLIRRVLSVSPIARTFIRAESRETLQLPGTGLG
jgi:predicted membrane metal-binding protein